MKKTNKAKKVQKAPADYGDYLLVNHEKLDRAINGTIGRGGKLEGGVGREAEVSVVLAEYDRLGGLVLTRDGVKLATGSFYDFENGRPFAKASPKPKPKVKAKGITTENVGDEEDKKSKKRKKPQDEEEEEEDEEDEEEGEDEEEEDEE